METELLPQHIAAFKASNGGLQIHVMQGKRKTTPIKSLSCLGLHADIEAFYLRVKKGVFIRASELINQIGRQNICLSNKANCAKMKYIGDLDFKEKLFASFSD